MVLENKWNYSGEYEELFWRIRGKLLHVMMQFQVFFV